MRVNWCLGIAMGMGYLDLVLTGQEPIDVCSGYLLHTHAGMAMSFSSS